MRRRSAIGASAAVSALIVASGSFAQTTGVVAGRVVDERGVPLGDAIVRVWSTSTGTVTDSAGRFVIGGIPAGDRMLVAEMIGYEQHITFVRVETGDTSRTIFRLMERRVPFDGTDDPFPDPELSGIATTLLPSVLRDSTTAVGLRNVWLDLEDGDTLVVLVEWIAGAPFLVEHGLVFRVVRTCAACIGRVSMSVEGSEYYVAAARHVRLGLRRVATGTPAFEFCIGPATPGTQLFRNCAGPPASFSIRFVQRPQGDWVRMQSR